MSDDNDRVLTFENPPTDLEGAKVPLIAMPDRASQTEEEVRLDGIPSVQKPGYGNWIWAEKRCARRTGLTVGEAMAIHAAYHVYQMDGDPREFYDYIIKFLQATQEDIEHTRGRWQRRLRWRWQKRLLQYLLVIDGTVQSDIIALIWGAFKLLTSRNNHEILDERIHTMDILARLLELFDAGNGGQFTLQGIWSDDQESQNHTSYALKSDNEKNLSASLTGLKTTPETMQEAATLVSAAEQTLVEETKSKTVPFDASKLDRRKFETLIRELLRSRSHEPGEQHPADDTPSPFLVIGWFPKGSSDPYERLITLKDDETVFKQLQKKVKYIRGWREYISLKSLSSFGLYECDIPRGAHVKLSLSKQHVNTISHFFRAYQTSRWHPDEDVSKAWTAWIQKNLNANKEPIEGKYSLELVYHWSPARLSLLVLFPVLFSFGTGLIYMLKTGDVSTAWTISSYIVTAAGAIVALLAILGSLKEH